MPSSRDRIGVECGRRVRHTFDERRRLPIEMPSRDVERHGWRDSSSSELKPYSVVRHSESTPPTTAASINPASIMRRAEPNTFAPDEHADEIAIAGPRSENARTNAAGEYGLCVCVAEVGGQRAACRIAALVRVLGLEDAGRARADEYADTCRPIARDGRRDARASKPSCVRPSCARRLLRREVGEIGPHGLRIDAVHRADPRVEIRTFEVAGCEPRRARRAAHRGSSRPRPMQLVAVKCSERGFTRVASGGRNGAAAGLAGAPFESIHQTGCRIGRLARLAGGCGASAARSVVQCNCASAAARSTACTHAEHDRFAAKRVAQAGRRTEEQQARAGEAGQRLLRGRDLAPQRAGSTARTCAGAAGCGSRSRDRARRSPRSSGDDGARDRRRRTSRARR